jgi:hypothetical protein
MLRGGGRESGRWIQSLADGDENFDLRAELKRTKKRKFEKGEVLTELERIEYDRDAQITVLYADGAAFHGTFADGDDGFNSDELEERERKEARVVGTEDR